MPARSSALRDAGIGPIPMTAGSTPATAVDTTRAIGVRPRARARSASTTSTADAPSLMPLRVAGRDRPAIPPERRLEPGQRLRRRVRARVLVAADDRDLTLATGHLDRHDLVVEPPGLDGGHRTLLALERERILALAADAPALGDVLGGLAHRVRVMALGELRVHEPPAEGRVGESRAPRDPRHSPP